MNGTPASGPHGSRKARRDMMQQADLPGFFALVQNYPNPFNPSTIVEVQIRFAAHVRVQVFDVLGREVATIVNERKEAGRHEAWWDAGNAASGVYHCRLTAGTSVAVTKMLLKR
jgi:hypothetical protein